MIAHRPEQLDGVVKAESEESVLRYLNEDVKRKQIDRQPRKIRNVVSELLARRGYAQANSAERCVEVWRSLVGPVLARVSRPGRIQKRVLQVVVATSAGVQELTMRRQAILEGLAREAPELHIVDLKFRVGVLD